MQVKICGLRTGGDVRAALDAGANAVGLVFADSPRRVAVAEAEALLRGLRGSVQAVAVFRTPDPGLLREVVALPFDLVQADADWDPSPLPEGMGFLPAFADGPDLEDRVAAWASARGPGLRGAVLVDGPTGGGRGVAADWKRVARVAARRPVVLAGGLDPATVGRAIREVRPFGVDVSSGVERSRGVKDPARIAAFVAAVRMEGA